MDRELSVACKKSIEGLNLALKLFELASDEDLSSKSRSALLSQAVDTLGLHIDTCLSLQLSGLSVYETALINYKDTMNNKLSHVSKLPTRSSSSSSSSEDDKKSTEITKTTLDNKTSAHHRKKAYR